MTNINNQGAPWLEHPNQEAAANTIWKVVELEGDTEEEFTRQIESVNGFIEANWKITARDSDNQAYKVPVALVLYRKDQRDAVAHLIPRQGERAKADFNLVIASQAYAASRTAAEKAQLVVAPLVRSLAPGGRFVGIHACGGDDAERVISHVIPGKKYFTTDCDAILAATGAELGAAASEFKLRGNGTTFPIARAIRPFMTRGPHPPTKRHARRHGAASLMRGSFRPTSPEKTPPPAWQPPLTSCAIMAAKPSCTINYTRSIDA